MSDSESGMENISKSFREMMADRNWNKNFSTIIGTLKRDRDIRSFFVKNKDKLDANAFEKSISKLYEFHNVKKMMKDGKKTFAPGYQPRLVVNGGLVDISYQPSPETIAAQELKAQEKMIRTISMPKDIRSADMDKVDRVDGRFDAMAMAYDFLSRIGDEDFTPGLYLSGPLGVGKTYMLGAIANRLAGKKIQTIMVHFPTFSVEMKNSIADNSVSRKIDSVKKTPVLMLDDIGAESMSPWVRDEVLGVILEYRMQQQLPTFFSSNLTMDKFEEHLIFSKQGDEEPLKAKRIMERVKFLSREVEMSGANRRPK
ncbi:primosomal protein DnaI [Lentilactobacillus sp. Marseille-Q4993]|uniref:primosomal protein DnaI n=1 Tax=Lentilactobacillus sp. Marseille-Q4993 TaxID=3039492 RepID=UPI0024BD097C|nr:primosomal protein DnaI [Lentilactobacillus sp. Marseille-Q4993]